MRNRTVFLCLSFFFASHSAIAVDVLTYHNNNFRTGANLEEKLLNPASVSASGKFGKLYTFKIEGHAYAQPLYVENVDLQALGKHNLLIAATMRNWVYAFDADHLSANGNGGEPLWKIQLGKPYPHDDAPVHHYTNILDDIGILSTPVIDRATQSIYVVSANVTVSRDGKKTYQHFLHRLDLVSGQERAGSPVLIQGSVAGNGDGSQNGAIAFDSFVQLQRPALLLSQGSIYVGFGGMGNRRPYHGWIFVHDAHTLKQQAVYNSTPHGGGAGFWACGAGFAADDEGYVYAVTGNGFDVDASSATDRTEALLKLKLGNGSLNVIDWFTPDNWKQLDKKDLDLGVTGVVLIPGTPYLSLASKDRTIYLENRNHLGHISNSSGPDSQEFSMEGKRVYGGPVYWKNLEASYVYLWPIQAKGQAFRFKNDHFDPASAIMQTSEVAENFVSPGGMLSVSANGSDPASGILWASMPIDQNAEFDTVPGILRAYDANHLDHLLWSSEVDADNDALGAVSKYAPPTVANGKVFVSTFSGEIVVYGLKVKMN